MQFPKELTTYEIKEKVVSRAGLEKIINLVYGLRTGWDNRIHLDFHSGQTIYVKSPMTGQRLTTEIKNYVYKNYKYSIPEGSLTEIGNIIQENSVDSQKYYFRFSDVVDWKAGEYGDGGSCWFNSNKGALQWFSEKPGFKSVLFYENEHADWKNHKGGISRAFLYESEAGLALLNGVGSFECKDAVNILCSYWNLPYKKVTTNNGGTLYTNSYKMYLINPDKDAPDKIDFPKSEEIPDYVTYSCRGCSKYVIGKSAVLLFDKTNDVRCEDCFKKLKDEVDKKWVA